MVINPGKILRVIPAKNISYFFYLLFVALTVLLAYYKGFAGGEAILFNGPVAKQGEWNISREDIASDKLLFVRGEFEFYHNRLFEPRDFVKIGRPLATQFVQVPSLWNETEVNGKKIGKYGYATYRLHINVPEDDWYGLKIYEINCAYRIWLNGNEVSAGKVGTSKEETIPDWTRKEIYCKSENKRIELIMQIANYHHRKGGPEDVMVFGRGAPLQQYKVHKYGLAMFMMGVLFILIIYFTGAYLFGRRDPSVVLFSLVCFFTLLRVATTGEKLFLDVLPFVSWEVAIRIEYLAFLILAPLVIAFMRSFYKDIFSRWVVWIISAVSAMFCIAVLFLPSNVFSYVPAIYQVVILLSGLYLLYGLMLAAFKRRTYSSIFLIGYVFFFVILINDILYYNKIVQSAYLLPYGLFILFFSYAYVMSKKLTLAYLSVEKLTHALDTHNRELEQTIRERTIEITEQKVAIERQAQHLVGANRRLVELNRFRDDMTGMIVHDLKNPLNSIINLSKMKDVPDKDELIWQAGKSMLNMVMNIVDINRSDTATLSLNKEKTIFNEIIDAAITDVSINTKLRDIVITKRMSSVFEIEGDVDILKRTCVNLLSNAIKYSPARGGINLSLKQHSENELVFSVLDEGPGIREDMMKVLFDPVKRRGKVDNSMRSSGMGLTFCKIAVEAHGGSIGVKSSGKSGAEFYIVLPVLYQKPLEDIEQNTAEAAVTDQTVLPADVSGILKPFIEQLSTMEIYEVSDIRMLIAEMKDLNLSGISDWLKELDSAVVACNSQMFENALNKVRQNEL